MDNQYAERIATSLEQIVEKLVIIESKLEELSYEVQAQGASICQALAPEFEECDN